MCVCACVCMCVCVCACDKSNDRIKGNPPISNSLYQKRAENNVVNNINDFRK